MSKRTTSPCSLSWSGSSRPVPKSDASRGTVDAISLGEVLVSAVQESEASTGHDISAGDNERAMLRFIGKFTDKLVSTSFLNK